MRRTPENSGRDRVLVVGEADDLRQAPARSERVPAAKAFETEYVDVLGYAARVSPNAVTEARNRLSRPTPETGTLDRPKRRRTTRDVPGCARGSTSTNPEGPTSSGKAFWRRPRCHSQTRP